MKKFFVVFFVGMMFFSNLLSASANFSDVSSSDTYYRAVEILQKLGVVNGYPDQTYRPNQLVNRAELLKILFVAAKVADDVLNPFADDECFNDVPANQWYTKYVCYAKSSGYVAGYEGGTIFRPEQNVTFVEALKMTMAVFGIGQNADQEPWYRGFVDGASSDNLILQDIESFNEPLNRGQMADLVVRVIKNAEGKLQEYLESYEDGREEIVRDYVSILADERRAKLGDLNIDPDSSPFIGLFIFTSKSDPSKVFSVLQLPTVDIDLPEIKDSGLPIMYSNEYNAYYYYDGLPNIAELKQIASGFSLEGTAENMRISVEQCYHVDSHDFSMIFPASWGEVDRLMILDEEHFGENTLPIEYTDTGVCEFGDGYVGSGGTIKFGTGNSEDNNSNGDNGFYIRLQGK